MFDAAEWDGDGLDLLPPPLPPDDFLDEHAYADWSVDEVTALDPERPRSAEEILRDAESGPINAALTAELASLNPATLTDDQQVALMVAADRCVNHYEGVKLTAVAAFAGPPPRDDVCDGAFAWTHIAAALRLGEGTARSYTHTARHVVSHLPRTLAAMRAGDASMTKVRTLADATVTMDKAQCGAVEDLVIERVRRRNPSQHTQAVGRAVRKVDPDGWARRREQKLADVAMIRTHHGDGVADVLLRAVDSYEAELLWTAADTWARQAKASGDPRTLDALRVAAVMTWCADYLGGRPITPTAG